MIQFPLSLSCLVDCILSSHATTSNLSKTLIKYYNYIERKWKLEIMYFHRYLIFCWELTKYLNKTLFQIYLTTNYLGSSPQI